MWRIHSFIHQVLTTLKTGVFWRANLGYKLRWLFREVGEEFMHFRLSLICAIWYSNFIKSSCYTQLKEFLQKKVIQLQDGVTPQKLCYTSQKHVCWQVLHNCQQFFRQTKSHTHICLHWQISKELYQTYLISCSKFLIFLPNYEPFCSWNLYNFHKKSILVLDQKLRDSVMSMTDKWQSAFLEPFLFQE